MVCKLYTVFITLAFLLRSIQLINLHLNFKFPVCPHKLEWMVFKIFILSKWQIVPKKDSVTVTFP